MDQSTRDKTMFTPQPGADVGYMSYPLRVVLISATGMFTLALPTEVKGHFRFQDENGLDADFPLYIEASRGEWVAFSERRGVYLQKWGREEQAAHVTLSDKMVARVKMDGEEILLLYVEAEHPGDRVFYPYYIEERMDYTIGRKPDRDIYYLNGTVSREHARLHWEDGSWFVYDDGSTNGVFVNGKRVKSSRLKNGDSIFIMGLYIIMGSGFIAMNNANDRVTINTPRIRRVLSQNEVYYPRCAPRTTVPATFDRQPRKLIKIPAPDIEIDMPPMQLSPSKVPLLLRMGSPMVMGGRAIATGNIISAVTGLVFPALTQGLTEKDRKDYESKREVRYQEYLMEKSKEIEAECQEEQRLLNENYPELPKALRFATTRQRLWERRRSDEDFLKIRMGSGRVPMLAEKRYTARRFEMEPDPLSVKMYELAEKEEILENAPVMLDLRADHTLGVYGDTTAAIRLLRNLILQIALTHSYDEVKIILMGEPEQLGDLDFVRYLPHNWDDDRTIRFFAASMSDAQQIGSYLSKQLEDVVNADNPAKLLQDKPAYVIFALSKKLFDCLEILKSVLRTGNYCGVSMIAAFNGAPKECSKILDLQSQKYKVIDLMHPEEEDQPFTQDYYDILEAQNSLRELMRTKLKIGSQLYELPNTLTFLEMFGAGMVEHLNPMKRWKDNNPVKSLSAPVGVGTDGKIFTLDLHEKRQGPHGLVAGMTGSGKSEFLITYILSMAVNYSPDEVAFILIDYKGGGLADAFVDKARGIHLPHIVGTITNLDGSAIQRSLMSINSELKRRQAVFKQAKSDTGEGTMDIYDYQKLYRAHRVSEPLPHLFIISDEFAELKSQQPEFMDELISTARIGRSLGVHLILATQKPGGVVNNQIWSNTKFRVCLKVQDRGDSVEMLKRPEAAELKQTGRFYLQVGYNEFFALGQSAWCGAAYAPQEIVQTENDDSVQFLDDAGQTLLSVKPKTEVRSTDMKQLVAIVQYISDLAKQEGIHPRPMWEEPLPAKLELAELAEREKQAREGELPPSKKEIKALMGMVDDPERQSQFTMYQDMLSFNNLAVIGTSGSGKSTLIRTMLTSLTDAYTPEQLNCYILDLSNGALSPFAKAPHCGAYLTEKSESDFNRLLDMIKKMIEERKALFAASDVSGFEAYLRVKTIPLILVIVDSYHNLNVFNHGTELMSSFNNYLRDGGNYGIRFILTCNHYNDLNTRVKQEVDGHIALRAKDRFEFTDILGARVVNTPPEMPGRGMCLVEGRALEFHTAMLDCDQNDQDRASQLRQRSNDLAERYRDLPPARPLPMVDNEQTYASFAADYEPGRIPLGYSIQDMRPVALPLKQMYDLSVYFGNPEGVAPVLRNILSAAGKSGMQITVLRRKTDSVFAASDSEAVPPELRSSIRMMDCVPESVKELDEFYLGEMKERNKIRDEYCAAQGIPLTEKGRVKTRRAAGYLREHTVPVLLLIESFADLCALEMTDVQKGEFSAFFSQTKAYNFYFIGGFYPDDPGSLSGEMLMAAFNREELLLFFGGRYDKQRMTNLPGDYKRIEKVNPKYDRFVMKYRDEYYPMYMPCGSLKKENVDPDEEPII